MYPLSKPPGFSVFIDAVIVHSDFGAQENKVCHYFYFFPSIFHKVMGLNATIFIFWMLSTSLFALFFDPHKEVMLVIKNLPAMWETGDTGWILGLGRSHRGENINLILVFFPGKTHGQKSLVHYSPWDHKESDMTKYAHLKEGFSSSSLSAITVIIICISEVVDISPNNLDSSLWFIQTGILLDVLYIDVK